MLEKGLGNGEWHLPHEVFEVKVLLEQGLGHFYFDRFLEAYVVKGLVDNLHGGEGVVVHGENGDFEIFGAVEDNFLGGPHGR